MRKIAFTMELTVDDLEKVKQLCDGWKIVQSGKEFSPEQFQDSEVIVGWKGSLVEHCLVSNTPLRWVQSWSAGVDKMPLTEIAKHDVLLTTASGIHGYQISENIFAMMLSFVRKVHISTRNQIEKKWAAVGSTGEIHGKTLGIIGVGEIGKETAKIAKAFGMTVLGLNSSGHSVENIDRMYQTAQLEELLLASDFVVNSLPLTKQTHHMIGQQQFQSMKSTAYYFNFGRGATTDEEAMYEALLNGTIAGAGLDVFEQEPLPVSSPLWEQENVMITPHNSGITENYYRRAMDLLLINLEDYIRTGKPTLNLVNLEKQY